MTTRGALRIIPQFLADYWPFRTLKTWNVGARWFEAQSHARLDESGVSRPVSFGVLTFFTEIALALAGQHCHYGKRSVQAASC